MFDCLSLNKERCTKNKQQRKNKNALHTERERVRQDRISDKMYKILK